MGFLQSLSSLFYSCFSQFYNFKILKFLIDHLIVSIFGISIFSFMTDMFDRYYEHTEAEGVDCSCLQPHC